MRTTFFCCILFLAGSWCFGDVMQEALKDGKAFGKKHLASIEEASENFNVNDITSEEESFDAEQAKKMVLTNQAPKSDVREHILCAEVQRNQKENRGFGNDEHFLDSGNELLSNNQPGLENVYEAKDFQVIKCKEAVDLLPVVIERNLQVNIVESIREEHQKKVCNGHREKKEWRIDGVDVVSAISELEKFKKCLMDNPTTKSVVFEKIDQHSSKMVVWYHLTHVDDAGECNCSHIENYYTQEPPREANDEWLYSDPSMLSLLLSPDCTLLKQDCTDTTPEKTINGKPVKRSCWSERLALVCKHNSRGDCAKLRSKNCDLIEKRCLQEGENGCLLWELSFKCYTKLIKTFQTGSTDASCLSSEDWLVEYNPNNSLPEITSKLSVFEEIEREMKAGQVSAEKIEIFDAKKMKCSKSIASAVMYDCCFSHSGLAKKAGLAKCTFDEIALAELREQGVCYYVGHYPEETLGIKSADKHVYCCFKTKLARIVNEKARKQLDKDWGSAKHPDCSGFSIDELARLDFSKLDLSEIAEDYAKKMPNDLQERLQNFQDRLNVKIKENPKSLAGENCQGSSADCQTNINESEAQDA